MSFTNQHPINLAGRVILLNKLRQISPSVFWGNEKVVKSMPRAVVSYEEEFEDGSRKEVVEYNWEFLIFDTTDHQLQIIFDEFFRRGDNTKESNLIGLNGETLKVEKVEKENENIQ